MLFEQRVYRTITGKRRDCTETLGQRVCCEGLARATNIHILNGHSLTFGTQLKSVRGADNDTSLYDVGGG